jgi:hypothetical protein
MMMVDDDESDDDESDDDEEENDEKDGNCERRPRPAPPSTWRTTRRALLPWTKENAVTTTTG